MELRTPWMPDEGGSAARSADSGPAGERRWRVDTRLTGLKIALAVVFLGAAALFGTDPVGLVIGLIAAAALGAFALRDLVAPVRLAADAGGVTVVTGFAGHRHLPWASIERIRVDERHRLGIRSRLGDRHGRLAAPVQRVRAERPLRGGRRTAAGATVAGDPSRLARPVVPVNRCGGVWPVRTRLNDVRPEQRVVNGW